MIILVTGGARSGKSSFAEKQYENKRDVVYIATSKVMDKEMEDRVLMHQKSRPSCWRTFEGNYDLDKAVGREENYLLDCITVLTSNIMYDLTKDEERISIELQKKVEDTVVDELNKLISEVKEKNYNLVLVTNEIGSSLVPESHIGRVFRDIQGRVNQRIASVSDEVYLVCCGMPVKIK
ncbi:bifunctional adenosylcobinamide kinase/adenosylcobinamide-phosphate guanylyltransferase [Anaerosalibacter bizertensis]|uniref:bifunctional adenosylcobinamide kinase/adenosylcobinamide-phosphate guanylyltransferase n=1 Tax=Anaerosalibacter bizertensis TaxID=932217 RepID=UPI001C0F1B8E|nr:bifunctional adenosylcobinamide kinase/adenosylcobinamide-phosphate guanylyltransferase [Anaerosalibacter bizertensis]MBU5294354.1 bifunctional adenosylcobinamide kinase/adenosylcobinamide-phosphate guanylyltransferase [Anaerosalibacter bizertensis]